MFDIRLANSISPI